MNKKVISFITILLLMLSLNIVFDKVKADESINGFSIYIDPVSDGPRYYNNNVGETDCIGLTDDTSCIYHLKLTIDNEEIETFDINKLSVESSNERVLDASLQSKSIEIKGLSEGVASVNITYLLDDSVYSYSKSWRINPAEPQVVSSVNTYVFLDKSDIEINKGETDEVSIYYDLYGTTAVSYPEGYTENSYYKYEWVSSDDSVAKIKGESNEKSVVIEGVKAGTTTVKCTITSVDGEMTPVEKIIKVTVADVLNDLYGEYEFTNNDEELSSVTRLYLKLNENGTAEFIESAGSSTESTSGTYRYENGKIIYTKVNYNDDKKTEYTGNYKIVEFNILKSNKLELVNGNNSFVLSKISGAGSNPKTGISKSSMIIILLISSFLIFNLIRKYTKFPKHN